MEEELMTLRMFCFLLGLYMDTEQEIKQDPKEKRKFKRFCREQRKLRPEPVEEV